MQRFFTYTALSGEFPWNLLKLIPGNHVVLLRNIRNLKNHDFITVNGTGKYKTIRFTTKALELLKDYDIDLYNYYMNITDSHKFRGACMKSSRVGFQQQLRRHRIAETVVMLYYLGTKFLPHEKPMLKSDAFGDKQSIPENFPCFYSSKELKRVYPDQSHKTEFARFIGSLITLGGFYTIYNTNDGLMKWHEQGEQKAQILIENIYNTNFNLSNYEKGRYICDKAIFLTKNLDVINEIFSSRSRYINDNHGFELLSFTNIFNFIYFIPIDIHGALQLSIMAKRDYQRKIYEKLSILDDLKVSDSSGIDCDGILNDSFVISFFDGNVSRLKRFSQSANFFPSKKFKVFCFDWQKDVLLKYFKDYDNVILETYTDTNIFKMLERDD